MGLALTSMVSPDLVEPGVEGGVALELVAEDQGAALRHDLAEDDARHHREIGKMSAEEPFLTGHVVRRLDAFFVAFRPVHQQHRLAVRKIILDFFSVHIFMFLYILRSATQAS